MLRDNSKHASIKIILLILVSVFTITTCVYNISPRKILFGVSSDTIFENDKLRVDQIGSISRLAVSYNNNGDVYATEDHYLYKNSQNQYQFEELGNFDKINPDIAERAKDFIARLRITRDLRKYIGANDIVVLRSNTILIFYDKIYRSVDQGRSFQAVFDYKENGLYQAFSHGIAVDQNDDVYFGEYNCSPRPHTIKIIKGSRDGTVWSIFYEFPQGEIFHIHSIKYDSFRDILWILSGDKDEESKLMFIDKSRKKVEILGSGDQGWRIVSLITTRDFLYWCSDNVWTGSNIYRYDFSDNKREKLAFVGKPSYYSTQLKDGTLVFSTTFEPASPYTKSFHPEPTTDLWISKNSGKEWYKILSVPGKMHDTEYGMARATIILPSGDYSSDYVFLTPRSTLDSHFATKVLKITWK